jgi:hypothetical protein
VPVGQKQRFLVILVGPVRRQPNGAVPEKCRPFIAADARLFEGDAAAILSQDIYKKCWRRIQMPESSVKLRDEQHHPGGGALHPAPS